jgi:hypothetical protein
MASLYQPNPSFGGLGIGIPVKRKVFVSYHHANDQYYYNEFSKYFSQSYDIFYDNSLDRKIDSTNAEYVNRKIREDYIVGSSATIVLCGSETFKRRWVDWEIHATLYHKHGLLGIVLPTCQRNLNQQFVVPDRLVENVNSGYARWIHWTNDVNVLKSEIEAAVQSSKSNARLIVNSAQKMKRSRS